MGVLFRCGEDEPEKTVEFSHHP